MGHITHRVILNHLQMSLPPSKDVIKYNQSLIKLYYQFLKKEGLFDRIYQLSVLASKEMPKLTEVNRYVCYCASSISNMNTKRLLRDGEYNLIYSQLWRGFLLDNFHKLEFFDEERMNSTLRNIRFDLQNNGTRGDKRVEKILEKYDIPKKITDFRSVKQLKA